MLVANLFSFFFDGLGLDYLPRGGLFRTGFGNEAAWEAAPNSCGSDCAFFTKNHWSGFCIEITYLTNIIEVNYPCI